MDARDADAFRALYRAHYATVCRYLSARTGADAVEDVAAETFLVAWRRQAELPDHPVPWLLNAAGKCLANQARASRRAAALAQRLVAVPAPQDEGADERLERRDLLQALVAALAELGESDRELLLLRHWDGLAPREVAAVLELSPVVVRARLSRASRRLQSALDRSLARAGGAPAPVELTHPA